MTQKQILSLTFERAKTMVDGEEWPIAMPVVAKVSWFERDTAAHTTVFHEGYLPADVAAGIFQLADRALNGADDV